MHRGYHLPGRPSLTVKDPFDWLAPPPGPVEDSQSSHSDSDSGDRYEVEVILQHRTLRGQRRYLVKWQGYGHQANSWLTKRQLRHAPDLLME